jgi:hypothetical protein
VSKCHLFCLYFSSGRKFLACHQSLSLLKVNDSDAFCVYEKDIRAAGYGGEHLKSQNSGGGVRRIWNSRPAWSIWRDPVSKKHPRVWDVEPLPSICKALGFFPTPKK